MAGTVSEEDAVAARQALHQRAGRLVDAFILSSPWAGGDALDVGVPRESYRDDASLAAWPGPGAIDYLFGGGAVERFDEAGSLDKVLALMDKWGVSRSQTVVPLDRVAQVGPLYEKHADRFFLAVKVNPHKGMHELRLLESVTREFSVIKTCSITPHQLYPQIPPSSREYYPVYAKCVELGLPVWMNVGIPGPRVPSMCQDPAHLDDVCWFFPELTVLMKHGGEPWVDMCVKLMLKWPNLNYVTTGFAPRHYPKAVIDYANTRGSDRIVFGGYWPVLTYERMLVELAGLPLRAQVWPKFLHANAERLFRLGP